jgi:hypothetical protein
MIPNFKWPTRSKCVKEEIFDVEDGWYPCDKVKRECIRRRRNPYRSRCKVSTESVLPEPVFGWCSACNEHVEELKEKM